LSWRPAVAAANQARKGVRTRRRAGGLRRRQLAAVNLHADQIGRRLPQTLGENRLGAPPIGLIENLHHAPRAAEPENCAPRQITGI